MCCAHKQTNKHQQTHTPITHHDRVDQGHDADGPHGAQAGDDDKDEVVFGLGVLLHGRGPHGRGAAPADLGRRMGRGHRQVSRGARPQRRAVAVLLRLQVLLATAVHVDAEGRGGLHPGAPGLRGHRQKFLCLPLSLSLCLSLPLSLTLSLSLSLYLAPSP